MLENMNKVVRENEFIIKYTNIAMPVLIIGLITNIVSLIMGNVVVAEIAAIIVIGFLFFYVSAMALIVKDTWEISRQFIEKYIENQ